MEREHGPEVSKLVDVARQDFPGAVRVGVSFPDQWEYVETVRTESSTLYIAGFPIERAFNDREHFQGLAPEINVNLVFYRLYKFFQPWPIPPVTVEWSPGLEESKITDVREDHLQLRPVGQAQAWFGVEHAVLWECYLEETERSRNGPDTLTAIWQAVERDVGAPKLFTLPYEPAFDGDYKEYLRGLGYMRDEENEGWWSKTSSKVRTTLSPT